MEILRVCLNEIALSGLEGCTIRELWQHLTSCHPPPLLKVDEPTQSFIWHQMRETVLRNGSVCVYQLPTQRPAKSHVTEKEGISNGEKWLEYSRPFPYRPVGTEEGVRGSCSTYHERTNITSSILREELDLTTLATKYGDSAVLVASQEVRERALFPDSKTCFQELSLVQYCVLEVVGAARQHGILRTEITKNYLKIDPRSTFHHCKMLESFDLLRIKMTHARRGKAVDMVHLLLLPCYPLPSWVFLSNYPTLISNLLLEAPQHTLPTSFVSKTIGSGFKSARDTLNRGGFVETILLPGKPVRKKKSKNTSSEAGGKVPLVRHLRLLKPYRTPDTEGGEEEEEEDGGGKVSMVLEVPIDMQGYRLVDSRGPEGINNSVFCNSALSISHLCSRQLSKSLIKSKDLVTILVDEDGIKKIRLVSARHVSKNKEYEKLLNEQAKSSFKDAEIGVRTGTEMFTDPVDRYRDRKKKKEKSGSGMSVAAATVSGTHSRDVNVHVPPVVSELPSELGAEEQNEKGSQTDFTVPPAPEAVPGPSRSPDTVVPHGDRDISPEPVQKAFKKSKQLLTYHQLKRLNIISKLMEEQKIVIGYAEITDHIRQYEKIEGRTTTVDKKTTEKCVSYLVDNGQLCLKILAIPDSPLSKSTSIIYVPDLCPEKLATIEEEILRTAHIKRETKEFEKESKVKSRMRKRRKGEGEGGGRKRKGMEREGHQEEDDETTSASDTETETVVVPNIAGMSKFQKLKHIHLLLWLLVHGFNKATPTVRSEVTANEDSTSDGKGEGELSHSSLPTTNFPWVATVMQLDSSGHGHGWLCYNDIIPNMPFSLLCMVMPTLVARGVIPAKWLCYFQDPDYQHRLVCQLPKRLRGMVTAQRHEISLLNHLLERLVEMGLLQVEGNLQTNKKRSQVFLRLTETVSILDTSSCSPRRSFFLESARPLFLPLDCTLTSLREVEHYWYQLQSMCMRTRIILKDRIHGSKLKSRRRGLQATPTKSAVNDLNSLPYEYQNKRISSEEAKEYNQRGFGAGGLPPLLFSHLKRNWCALVSWNVSSGGMEHGVGVGSMGIGGNGMEWSYGPGMGLNSQQLPFVVMDNESGDRGEESEGRGRMRVCDDRGPPPLKKACLDSRPRVQGHIVQIPSHQVQRHSGGRGFQRARTKKVLEVAKRLKKVKTSRYLVSKKTAVLVMDSDANKEVMVGTHRERARWFPHEDSFLLLAYLASHALRQVTGQATVSYRQIRDALHAEYNTSRAKSINAVQRRIVMLRRQRKNLSATVNVCLAEILSEIAEMGSAAPEPTFTSLLSFVTQRYKSQGGLILGKTSTLPSSLSELQREYTVVGWGGSEGEEERGGLSLDDEHSINQAFLADLILATLGAEESSYDHYAAFRTFESFPEADSKAAFDGLRSQLLIRRRRAIQGIPRHGGPLQCQSFELAANFNNKLEYSYFHGTSSDAAKCAENLAGKRSEVTTAMQQWKLPESEDSGTCISGSGQCSSEIAIGSGAMCGGIVACLLSTLFRCSGTATCDPVMPKKLFETDGDQDSEKTARQLMEVALREEEEEEGEGEGGDEEDKGPSSSVRDSHRFSGMGLGHLLQVNENSIQNHGSMTLDLDLPWFSLLSPLSEEEPPPSLTSWNTSQVSPDDGDTSDPPLSLPDYLLLCKHHLHMSENDLHFSSLLYGVIEESGERGVKEGELREHGDLSSLSFPPTHSLSLSDHLQHLLNFEMIKCVGITEERFVTMCHAQRWCMPVCQSRNGPQRDLVPYRPWVTINSTHPNTSMMTRYRQGILTYIMASPGVTMRRLLDHFSGMLHFTALRQILQSLEQEGVVTLHNSGTSGCDLDSVYCQITLLEYAKIY